MQEATQSSLDLIFPKQYLQRLEQYHKRQVEILSKRRRVRKPPVAPKNFSDNCKQATYLANKTYCCVLKEFVEGSLCKACPCYEQEPLEYSLFRRVGKQQMKCPNNRCKNSIETTENTDTNFDYCKECGTIIYRRNNK